MKKKTFAVRHDRRGRGFTLLELVVVVAIAGTLLALLIPAVMSLRQAAARIQCANNLKQIGLGLHNYESAFGRFPPGNAKTPWTVAAGSFFGLEALCQAYDKNEDPYHPNNVALGTAAQKVFSCPNDNEIHLAPTNWIAGNYAANSEVLDRCNSPLKCTDGASCTILAVEIAGQQGLAYITGPSLFPGIEHSLHKRCFNVVFVDGSVRALPTSISDRTMLALGTPDAGDNPDDD